MSLQVFREKKEAHRRDLEQQQRLSTSGAGESQIRQLSAGVEHQMSLSKEHRHKDSSVKSVSSQLQSLNIAPLKQNQSRNSRELVEQAKQPQQTLQQQLQMQQHLQQEQPSVLMSTEEQIAFSQRQIEEEQEKANKSRAFLRAVRVCLIVSFWYRLRQLI